MAVHVEKLTLTHSKVDVADASTQIIAADSDPEGDTPRRYVLLQNQGDEDVDVRVGVAAVKDESIRMYANGGTFELKPIAGQFDNRAIFGIHVGSGGTKRITIMEGKTRA